MSWFTKNANVPSDLLVAIPKSDQLLAWAPCSGGFLAVTDKNLICTVDATPTLTPWAVALQARWEPPILTLVTQLDSSSGTKSQTWTLVEPGKIPSAVRDRVTSTVIVDRVYELPNAGSVRFVARRNGQNVPWLTVAEDTSATQSEAGAQDIAHAIDELKSIFGI